MKKVVTVLAILAVVGGVGYYLYDKNKKKNTSPIVPPTNPTSTSNDVAVPEHATPPLVTTSTGDSTKPTTSTNTTPSTSTTVTQPSVPTTTPSAPIAPVTPVAQQPISPTQTTPPAQPLIGKYAIVDYTNNLNNPQANMDYLNQNKDVANLWDDKDAYGNTIGWSHFILYGQHEGRTWDGYGTNTVPTPSVTQPTPAPITTPAQPIVSQPSAPILFPSDSPQTFPTVPETPTTQMPIQKANVMVDYGDMTSGIDGKLEQPHYIGTYSTVDYTNPLNTIAANQDYLNQNKDVANLWNDRDAYGNTVGWSHFILFGEHEGRTWDGFTAPAVATPVTTPVATPIVTTPVIQQPVSTNTYGGTTGGGIGGNSEFNNAINDGNALNNNGFLNNMYLTSDMPNLR